MREVVTFCQFSCQHLTVHERLSTYAHTRHGTILLDLLAVLLAPNFQTLPSQT